LRTPSGASPYGLPVLSDQPGDEHARAADLQREEELAAGIVERLTRRLDRVRDRVHRRPGLARIWRLGIALVGLVVVIVGVILLVLPGPGWAVIFVGLGIWAIEFAWARSLLTSVRRALEKCMAWIREQPRWRIALMGGVAVLVLAAVAVGAWMLAT
jgi:uncharacterized protein (TIGR02611 family)